MAKDNSVGESRTLCIPSNRSSRRRRRRRRRDCWDRYIHTEDAKATAPATTKGGLLFISRMFIVVTFWDVRAY